MSEQSKKLKAKLRESGVVPPGEPPPADEAEDGGRANLPPLELPRAGWGLDDFAREAGKVTKLNGVFRREKMPVTINKESGGIEALDADEFRTYLADLALLFKWRSVGKDQPPERVKETMTVDTARGTLKSPQFLQQQRRLARVNQVRQPVMRGDGRIELLPEGYDAESGVFTMANEVTVRDDMTKDEACALLLDLHREFPFPDWLEIPVAERLQSADFSRQLALMLGFYGALLLPHTALRQGGFFNANRERSGKGLLARLVVVPVSGRGKFRSKPDNQEEFRKVLDTTALSAAPYLVLDDLSAGNLKSQDLNAFMTTAWWTGRLMNSQREFEAPLHTSVFLTGHNITLTGDLAGRFLEVKLHMEEADSQQHRIVRELDEAVLSQPGVRGDICSALWALIRHWDIVGRPKSAHIKPGFRQWSETFAGIVEAAGFQNPLEKRATDESPDPEYEDMRALVTHLMTDVEKQVEVTFDQFIEAAQALHCLEWMMDGKWHHDKGTDEKYFEASAKCNSRVGGLLSQKYGGALFRLVDGRKVRFGKRGKNRHKRYVLTAE